jgi:hypothetical protein
MEDAAHNEATLCRVQRNSGMEWQSSVIVEKNATGNANLACLFQSAPPTAWRLVAWPKITNPLIQCLINLRITPRYRDNLSGLFNNG